MHFSLTKMLTPALITFFSLASASTVKLINHCPHDLYFWVVGGEHVPDRQWNMVPGNGGSVIHSMLEGRGMSLKIRDVPQYEVAPAGILQLEYNFAPQTKSLWYDLSLIDCYINHNPYDPEYCPFVDGGIRLYTNGPSERCPTASCIGEECVNTYQNHGTWIGEPTLRCDSDFEVFFETCTHGSAPQTFIGEYTPPLPLPPSPPSMPPTPPSSSPSLEPEQPCPAHGEPTSSTSHIPTSSTSTEPASMPSTLLPPSSTASPSDDMPGSRPALIYTTPPEFPNGTLCHDPECNCYSTTRPWLFPSFFPWWPLCGSSFDTTLGAWL
ncbi:hypothetical protein BDV95DRAFT_667760 [Massariosphaeria phaeospora]|uniref:Uncharacterized protein n=1 Tax=Massariosphaeria phaeospora TaxID=100035 RepID=A0A7C8MF90_9PLEO|nr:hypothetical protein BDV95DRAFT_667760 [Massariosphaeria phaeospora]